MGNPGPGYDPLTLGGTPFVLHRERQDKTWAFIFAALYAASVIGTAFFATTINPQFFKLTPSYLNDTRNCPLHPSGSRQLLGSDDPPFDGADFAHHAALWLVLSVVASLAVAVAFLHLVRHHAHTLTKATIGFQLALPTIAALSLALTGNLLQALLAGGLAVLTFFVFYLWRRELGVASKLMGVSGHALSANSSLIGVTVLLNLAGLVLALPPLAGVLAGFANGDVAPNPDREGRSDCVDALGSAVPCCVWEPRPSGAAFMALAALAAAWTMFTLNQIRVFVVSGAVAQWYFAAPGAPTTGNVSRSLKHALTTSFGTNAFAGLVITLTNAIKRQGEQDRQQGNMSLWGVIASFMASLLEYLTKFATVMASITGQGLMDAGRNVTDLLARNFLEAFATTVWFPSAVLTLVSVTISALWGSAVWAGYRYLHQRGEEMHPDTNALIVGIAAGVVTMFVLSFLAGMLLSVLDSVFVCFAVDKDRRSVTNAFLYEELLSAVEERGAGGVLVEEPAGQVEYGAAASYEPPRMRR